VSGRALVLGGGGAAGNAWEIGVVAGLADAGVDVTAADLIIGTSAGSTVAAQITSAAPADLYAATLVAPPPQAGPRPPTGSLADLLAASNAIIAAASDPADLRRRLGAAALELDATADPAAADRRRALVATRLPSQDWPAQRVQIVAVDAHTGEPVVFDRHSGVDLADAVTASTSGPGAPPHRIGDRRYLDGGYRAGENADLAAGHDRVLVLAPFGGRTRMPLEWGIHLAAQVDALRAAGSRVETIFPDDNARAAFGETMMELSTRPAAARAGYDQGRALGPQLTDFWR
jgi:NTE family protein